MAPNAPELGVGAPLGGLDLGGTEAGDAEADDEPLGAEAEQAETISRRPARTAGRDSNAMAAGRKWRQDGSGGRVKGALGSHGA